MVQHILNMNWLNVLTIALGLTVLVLSAILAVRGILLNERRRRDEKALERVREELDRQSFSRRLEKHGFGRPGTHEHKALAFR